MSDAKPKHASLHHAKLAVMEEVCYLQKKKSAAGGLNYAFVGEEAIVSAMHDAFIRHNLTVSVVKVEVVKVDVYTNAKGTMQNHTILLSTFRLTHADSKESEESMAIGEGMDVGDKSANKASTGAYKYFFRQAFMIPTGSDPDNHDSRDMARGQQQQDAQQTQVDDGWSEWTAKVVGDIAEANKDKLSKIMTWVVNQNAPAKELTEIKLAAAAREAKLLQQTVRS
jgi:hypothetical protein